MRDYINKENSLIELKNIQKICNEFSETCKELENENKIVYDKGHSYIVKLREIRDGLWELRGKLHKEVNG